MAALSQREAYERLMLRNQVVAGLRLGLPVLGGAGLAYLVLALLFNALTQQFSFASLSIDRDQLSVAAPHLSVTGEDGSVFEASAEAAAISAGDPDRITLSATSLTRTPGDETATLTLTSPSGVLEAADQRLTLPERSVVAGSDGLRGQSGPAVGEIGTGLFRAEAIDLTFAGGATLSAASGGYDAATGRFRFSDVVVTLPDTPGRTETAP